MASDHGIRLDNGAHETIRKGRIRDPRALIELAAAGGDIVTSGELCKTQAIPGNILEIILTELRRAGLVRTERGPEGGSYLARPAEEISLTDIIGAVSGPRLGTDE